MKKRKASKKKHGRSPVEIAKRALEIGRGALPAYASKYSRRDFTLPQLFAILVLRKYFKTDYRDTIQWISEWTELREALELRDKVPHFTTPQKAADKLFDDALVRKLLKETLDQISGRYPTDLDDDDTAWLLRLDQAAGDSTGFESGHCSRYFTQRRKRGKTRGEDDAVSYRRFPKLSLLIDCATHLILSVLPGQGPRPDVDELEPLLARTAPNVVFDQLLLDAGYDSEANHERLREGLGIESIIPAKIGRPTARLPRTKWRWLMATAFDEDAYGQRWQVETVMSMLKRRLGAALTARSDPARAAEMSLMAITHNIMIL